MDGSNKTQNVGIPIIVGIIGLLVGFGITLLSSMAYYHNKLNVAELPTSATKAADLRATLVTLGVEHMTLTDQAIDAALDGSPTASASAAALYANGNTIGAAVGSIYGNSAQTTFDSVWKLHLDQFVNYAVADKEGNTAAMQTALNTIQTSYTVPLAQYLAKANPKLSESALQTALTDHVSMTAMMIDDHVKGDYTAEFAELDMANTHMEELFSTLANGIVAQYPSKF
jgi:hypothetical protein